LRADEFPTQAMVDLLGRLLVSYDVLTHKDDWRRAAALLSWVIRRARHLLVDENVRRCAVDSAAIFFETDPSDITSVPSLNAYDGLPSSVSDCARALLFSLGEL
jgi:hypothetical protein